MTALIIAALLGGLIGFQLGHGKAWKTRNTFCRHGLRLDPPHCVACTTEEGET